MRSELELLIRPSVKCSYSTVWSQKNVSGHQSNISVQPATLWYCAVFLYSDLVKLVEHQ